MFKNTSRERNIAIKNNDLKIILILKIQNGFCIRSKMKKETVLKLVKTLIIFVVGFAFVLLLCYVENPSRTKQPMVLEALVCAVVAFICTYLPDIIKKRKNRKK